MTAALTGSVGGDSVVRVATLGVRFRELASGRAVSAGLDVRDVASSLPLEPNRSGIFIAPRLPGLRDVEDGRATGPAQTRRFVVRDVLRRYAPYTFAVDLPAWGLWQAPCAAGLWPAAASSTPHPVEPAMPLLPAPTWSATAALATVRATLWDAAADAPAAAAVLEVTPPGGATALGIADDEGRVAVALPWPEPSPSFASSTPGGTALTDLSWTVDLAVRYGPLPAAGTPGAEPPDLCAALAQPHRTLADVVSPPTPLLQADLTFGRELALRSAGRSVLLVTS